jgi:hypothetical protein
MIPALFVFILSPRRSHVLSLSLPLHHCLTLTASTSWSSHCHLIIIKPPAPLCPHLALTAISPSTHSHSHLFVFISLLSPHHVASSLSLPSHHCLTLTVTSLSSSHCHLIIIKQTPAALFLSHSHCHLIIDSHTHSHSHLFVVCHLIVIPLSPLPLFSHCHLIIVQFLSLPPLCNCCLTLFVISLLFTISSVTHSAHHHVTTVSLHFVTNDVYYFSFYRMTGSGFASSQWMMGMLSGGKQHGKALVAMAVV